MTPILTRRNQPPKTIVPSRHSREAASLTWRARETRAPATLALALICQLAAVCANAASFPDILPLPNGFRPEGIAVGSANQFYVGSIPTGAIYRGDLRTGSGDILVPAVEGRAAIGLSYDSRSGVLFVAGGPTGTGIAYDGQSGDLLGQWLFTAQSTFVNDVVVTRQAAYFTDSQRPVIYRVHLGPAGRFPADETLFDEIPLGGEFAFLPGEFNSNGIDATPDGRWLVIVNSSAGVVYRVDPQTGQAKAIDLGGELMTAGDGLLLHGQNLYVVRNRLNQIAVIELNSDLTAGEVLETLTDPGFQVPTTIARHGNSLYAVNARFGVPPSPDTEYNVVKVER